MQNKDVFKNYGSEQWVVEEELVFLLQNYWENLYKKGYVKESHMPLNPVSEVKKFMKEETYANIEYAEKSKMSNLENTVVIDADATVIDEELDER